MRLFGTHWKIPWTYFLGHRSTRNPNQLEIGIAPVQWALPQQILQKIIESAGNFSRRIQRYRFFHLTIFFVKYITTAYHNIL